MGVFSHRLRVFFFIIVKFLEELFTYLSTDKVFMVITIIKAKLILTD